jgi:hypothetical protein
MAITATAGDVSGATVGAGTYARIDLGDIGGVVTRRKNQVRRSTGAPGFVFDSYLPSTLFFPADHSRLSQVT